MKIVLTDYETISDDPGRFDPFREFGELALYDTSSEEDAAERLRDADIAVCNKTPFTRRVIENAPALKYIGLFATGYNNIDIIAATERDITVCNAGSYSTRAVAQHTFALILDNYSRVAEYSSFVNEGGWKKCRVFSPVILTTRELSGKTLGIVGYGNIGKEVAGIAAAFGMKVIVYTRTPGADKNVEYVSFGELLSRSDIITVHCPLTDATRHMFDLKAFEKCRRDALFVNASRGGVVREEDLRTALETGLIRAAAIDVLTEEPMREDNVLFGVKGLTITPHIAWAPQETVERLIGVVIRNIRNYLNGKPSDKVN